ncbi:MAG: hypothetical protein LBR83_04095, partial [Clostridiales bacterium]|nr:hypothetical protein [Clostridiales bacterium]
IELEIDYGSKDTYTRLYEFPGTRQISLRDELLWAAPARCCNDSRLSLRLISPKLLRINGGEIRVVEIKDG